MIPIRTVEISLAVSNVPLLDGMIVKSKSDPFCVIYMKNGGHWCRWACTETVPNASACKWTEKIQVRETDGSNFLFAVYDRDSPGDNLSDQEHIGSVEAGLEELVASPEKRLSVPLVRSHGQKNCGTLEIAADFLVSEGEDRSFGILVGLDSCMKGKHYYEISKKLPCGDYFSTYRSPTLEKNASFFKGFETKCSKIAGGELSRALRLEIYHCEGSIVSSAGSKLTGFVDFSLQELWQITSQSSEGDGVEMTWTVPPRASEENKKSYHTKIEKRHPMTAVLSHDGLDKGRPVFTLIIMKKQGLTTRSE